MTRARNILIRCDASAEIGTGHVRRCISLASALRELGMEITFVVRDLGVNYAAIFDSQWQFHLLPAPADHFQMRYDRVPYSHWAGVQQALDATQTIGVFSGIPVDWIIVDHYAFDADWHERVRKGLGCKIAVIDDLADRQLATDILIDHNLHPDHVAKYLEVVEAGTLILGGPEYALLGSAYADARKYQFSRKVRSIGVFMGGANPGKASEAVLRAINCAKFEGQVEVVSTTSAPFIDELIVAVEARENVELSVDIPDLADFFGRHDLQIGAGGGALWERFSLGAPTIGVICAENQRHSIPHLERVGALVGFDFLQKGPNLEQELGAVIAKLVQEPDQRKLLSAVAKRLVDGKGAKRVAEKLIMQF